MKWSLYRRHVCFSQSLMRALIYIYVSSTNRKKLKKNKIVGIGEIPVRPLKDSAEIIAKPLTILIKIHYLMGLCQVNGNLLVLFPCLREGRPRTWITTVLFLACLRYPSYWNGQVMTDFTVFLVKWSFSFLFNVAFVGAMQMNMLSSLLPKLSPKYGSGALVGAVFIDLRKAFDTVDLGLLLEKLLAHGLEGNELNLV